jgi:uncharacterized protein (TIGR02117 family)
LRRFLKFSVMALVIPLGPVALYFAVAFGLVLVPANDEPPPGIAMIDAYIVSNGVHADFVFPVRSPTMNWTRVFPLNDFLAVADEISFIAIGWGDREFYLNTPHWKDLTVARAMNALLGHNQSLLHVAYIRPIDLSHGESYRLPLTESQYSTLAKYVLKTARLSGGKGISVPGRGYGFNDAFYEATGSYSLFNTCNAWVGRGLLRAGVTVSRWTPFEFNVYWYLQRRGGVYPWQ